MFLFTRLFGEFLSQALSTGVFTVDVDPTREILSVYGLGKFWHLYFLFAYVLVAYLTANIYLGETGQVSLSLKIEILDPDKFMAGCDMTGSEFSSGL